MKHSAPFQVIDARIGNEEQKKSKKLEEDLRAMVGHFVQVCRRRGLKANASKRKVMMFGGEEGLECEVCVDGIRLKDVSEFKNLGFVLDESGTDEVECRRMVAISSLVNARG